MGNPLRIIKQIQWVKPTERLSKDATWIHVFLLLGGAWIVIVGHPMGYALIVQAIAMPWLRAFIEYDSNPFVMWVWFAGTKFNIRKYKLGFYEDRETIQEAWDHKQWIVTHIPRWRYAMNSNELILLWKPDAVLYKLTWA